MAVKHFLFVDEIVVDGTMFSFSDSLNECIVTDLFAERYNYEIGETIYINSESDVYKRQLLTESGVKPCSSWPTTT